VSRFAGLHFDGVSSKSTPVELELVRDGTLLVRGLVPARTFHASQASVSARLGRTPRLLRLPGGSSLELPDSDALEEALVQAGVASGHGRRVFGLERRWTVALAALLMSAALLAWAVRDGVPTLARLVATLIPARAETALGEQILGALDGQVFAESALDAARRERIQERFARLLTAAGAPEHAQLVFRAAPKLGANAFALPSGIVVVSDPLVALAETDDDVVAVLAHELGHVLHRHSLRSLLQNVGVGVLVAGVLGDFTSISAAASTMPVTLVQLQYSRRFEREADAAGAGYLDAVGVPREHLARMLERLAASHGGDSAWSAYLSTHPATAERVAALREAGA
jgi:predicted Zn-dependent protease